MTATARLQDLPPAQARLCLKVRAVLAGTLEGPGPHSLHIGLSGGTDSTALLLILHALAPSCGLHLQAAHLDHALRPESAAEAEHCATLCAGLGVPMLSRRVDVAAHAAAHGLGTEEAARACRYAWFEEARRHTGAAYTLTAHQGDDLAEDILMRLIRGAGWPALGGMSGRDDERRILRPLLYIPRADLELFLEACGVSPLSDPSNDDRRYLRNRVRHEILPLLLRENPAFLEQAVALHRSAAYDAEFFRHALPDPARDLHHAVLRGLPKALRLRLYKSCLDALGPGQALADGLERLDDLYLRRQTGSVIQFPGGKTAGPSREGVAFRPGGPAETAS